MQMYPVRHQNLYKRRASVAVVLDRSLCSDKRGEGVYFVWTVLWLSVPQCLRSRDENLASHGLVFLCCCKDILAIHWLSVFCFREENFSFFSLFSSYSSHRIRREKCCLALWVSILDDTSVFPSNAYRWKGSDLDQKSEIQWSEPCC